MHFKVPKWSIFILFSKWQPFYQYQLSIGHWKKRPSLNKSSVFDKIDKPRYLEPCEKCLKKPLAKGLFKIGQKIGYNSLCHPIFVTEKRELFWRQPWHFDWKDFDPMMISFFIQILNSIFKTSLFVQCTYPFNIKLRVCPTKPKSLLIFVDLLSTYLAYFLTENGIFMSFNKTWTC